MEKKPTYIIDYRYDTIKCLICGRVSHSIKDVINVYCGNCHIFHEVTNYDDIPTKPHKSFSKRLRTFFDRIFK